MNFHERLSLLRKEKCITQTQLSVIIGLSRGTIGMYEIGKRDPDTQTIIKIADYFNVSTDYLLGKSNIKNIQTTKSTEHILLFDFTIYWILFRKLSQQTTGRIYSLI